MKIMVGIDGSPLARRALHRAIEIFRPLAPEIVLVTVVEETLDASGMGEQIFDKWRESRQRYLKEMADWAASQGAEVDALMAVGDPRKMLQEAIRSKSPDLIVIGRRGASDVEAMRLGSVSAFLIRHAGCDVLLVHK